ncbi:MAG: LuxR C-terminal-related transcriptional regulator [Pseudomonadota bacterium]
MSALVLCALPIVRAGIVQLIRARFGDEIRVVSADGLAPHPALAAADQRFDILIFHPLGVITAARLSRIAAAARESVVIVVGPQAGPRLRALPAFARWIALGAPIDDWCRVMRAAIDDARRRASASNGAIAVGQVAATPPGIAARLLPPKSAAGLLTPRQRDVFEMLCIGLSNKSIAEQLDRSIGTVKLHVAAILRALHAKRRVEIVLRRADIQQLPARRPAAAAANDLQRAQRVKDAFADDRFE